ncbi:fimbrillin family protein [Bacteroides fragilis]|uniref:Fimbrillin-like n=2 Tax=Bacteroidales TaxID=171549 RepID=A0A1H3YK12_9BACE|nr:fimbrillin family protein [Bacteroides xylanisolvens]MCS2493329.1 fimbrillin family protein [Bacteroides fragilis]MCS2509466.1 fimbrillin family protein [Bacteroides fragilis]SEA11969.1 Fimbrillin-like [Bacteroides xylanisolvens]
MKVHKKNPSWMAGGMATMLLCTLLFSCNNEDFLESGNPEKACDNICFGISSDKNVQTRGYAGSDDEGYTADRFVLRSDDSADTLCVRAIVSDGINVSGFEGEQALTRATPVDKDNFYDKFHVLAYWSKNGASVDQFYMNTNASNSAASVGTGAKWSTEQIYYWPGADHSFQFYAWAPTDAGGLTTPSSPQDKSLAYTVPEAATDQKDIVVATTNEIQGDNNAAVPLTFKHICTAVRFAVGSQMQPGSIKSVALKGVKNAGTYDMAGGTWSIGNATVDFSQTLNKETTGTEANGDAITSPEGTFMMLPQTLPAGATVEVVFTNASGVDRTLAASIGNTVWTMGTTVTYKLSITPEYEMNIEVPTEAQDAHYITFPITVNVKDYDGAWTLTSNLSNDVFFTQTKTDLQEQGYWIDDDKGANTISSTGSGSFTYHVYVTENIGDAARDLQFQITPTVNGATPITATVQQLCPSWNGNIGCERIEDGAYPWGFLWDSNMTIKYTVPSLTSDFIGHYISSLLIDLSNVGQYNYVTIDRILLSIRSITIDFSKLTANGVAEDLDNGLQNTNDIYNYNGANEASDLIARLERYGCTPDKELPTNPSDFAAKSCVLKNKFTKKTESQNGVSVDIPVLINLEWYLPAKTEAPNMEDETYPLNGIYWTSTALQGSSEQSYIYSNGNSESTDKRDVIHNVRAVRQKP